MEADATNARLTEEDATEPILGTGAFQPQTPFQMFRGCVIMTPRVVRDVTPVADAVHDTPREEIAQIIRDMEQ